MIEKLGTHQKPAGNPPQRVSGKWTKLVVFLDLHRVSSGLEIPLFWPFFPGYPIIDGYEVCSKFLHYYINLFMYYTFFRTFAVHKTQTVQHSHKELLPLNQNHFTFVL